ncbi:MAG: hypothetical protein D6753_00970 [Planctomycetota bacterium]|nr:MAG: hypothetical protein D6753_00970 [Planctomycetota bacterium]
MRDVTEIETSWQAEEPRRAGRGWIYLLVGIGLCLAAFASVVWMSFEEEDPARAKARRLEAELTPAGLDDHPPLRFANDELALTNPPFRRVIESDIDDRLVCGIEANGKSVAIILRPTERRDNLILSTTVGGKPIVVTHNYLLDTTRVFTGDSTEPIDLRLGGFTDSKQLVLLYQDVRYLQESDRIPLPDYPYVITTLRKWYADHPDTLLNDSEQRNDIMYYWPTYQE